MGYVIYEASAGSGKTTKMVYEYLQKLFSVQPQALKQAIESSVAITFTNKATSEMKERIITTLWRFIDNDIPNEYGDLCSILKKNNIDIQKQSRLILSTILHNYYIFNITTIDSFIQKIARSIAYELELPINYKVSLDSNKIISMACKRIIKKLGQVSENSELTEILQQFANYIIFEKHQYNMESTLINMAQSFSNEQFYGVIDALYDTLDMKSLYDLCSEQNKKMKDELTTKANDFLQTINNILAEYSILHKDIFYYSGCGNYTLLQKFANPNTDFSSELIRDSFDRLTTPIKRQFKHNERATLEDEISAIFRDLMNTYLIQKKDPLSVVSRSNGWGNKGSALLEAQAILKTYFIIVLMEYVFKEIESISKEENTVLLSEFTRIMNKNILANDIPYIFLKLDYEINRLFIDEFQDTSQLQWNNLALFKDNMISENRDFYIIGDPKQAIYRWRNGNVKIMLNEIDFIEENKSYNSNYEHISLDTNYRSLPKIIEFNNDFFSKLIAILENDPYNIAFKDSSKDQRSSSKKLFDNIIASYKKLKQKPSNLNTQEGFVKIDIIQRNSDAAASDNSETAQTDDENSAYETYNNSESSTMPQESVSKCVLFIKELFQKGYRPKDIAVLIRENRQAIPITEAFLKEGIDFINNNSLAVYNSPAVQCLLCLLSYFANTEDSLSLYTAMQLYIQYYSNDASNINLIESIRSSIGPQTFTLYNLYSRFQTSTWFEPFKIVNENFLSLKSLDLYNLIEALIRIFKFKEHASEYIYLQFFLDYVFSFIKNNQDSISNFLSYYNTNKENFLLSLSEQTDAVQIMSIHMSKGLQFPVVIIPDADFTIKTDEYITAPIFSSITIKRKNNNKNVKDKSQNKPVNYIYKNHRNLLQLKETVKPVLEAKADTILDNINLLYVAMTRAKQALYMIVPVKETINPPKKLSESIIYAPSMSHYIRKTLEHYDIPTSIAIGALPDCNCKNTGQKLPQQDLQKSMNQLKNLFISNSWQSKLVIKTSTDNIAIALNQERRKQIDFGNLMHRFLSEVHSFSDIAETIKKPYYSKLSHETQKILLANAEWVWNEFQNRRWTEFPKHYFERGVLYKGEEKRPDCVFADNSKAIIIDYKTGLQADETENDIKTKYKDQLSVYSDIYRALGFTEIKTFIMLPEKHKIIALNE